MTSLSKPFFWERKVDSLHHVSQKQGLQLCVWCQRRCVCMRVCVVFFGGKKTYAHYNISPLHKILNTAMGWLQLAGSINYRTRNLAPLQLRMCVWKMHRSEKNIHDIDIHKYRTFCNLLSYEIPLNCPTGNCLSAILFKLFILVFKLKFWRGARGHDGLEDSSNWLFFFWILNPHGWHAKYDLQLTH